MRDVNSILASPDLQDIKRRFFAKIKVQPNGCHEWTASKYPFGYGDFSIKGRSVRAHRLAWVLANGAIPELPGPGRTMICHTCDNPSCCNPAHLFVGKALDNNRDMAAKKRGVHGETHPFANISLGVVEAVKAYKGTSREAAEVFGITRHKAWLIKTNRTWKSAEATAYFERTESVGEANPSAKLTRAQAERILADTRTYEHISAEYGVSVGLVSKIKRRQLWKCLSKPNLDKS